MRAIELLDALAARRGLRSDYAIAKALGISRQNVSHYRRGVSLFNDQLALRLADELGLDRAAVLALLAAERARDPGLREIWARAADRLSGGALCILLSRPRPCAPRRERGGWWGGASLSPLARITNTPAPARLH